MKKPILKISSLVLMCALLTCVLIACNPNVNLIGGDNNSSNSSLNSDDGSDDATSEMGGNNNSSQSGSSGESVTDKTTDHTDDNKSEADNSQTGSSGETDNNLGTDDNGDDTMSEVIGSNNWLLQQFTPLYANVGDKYREVMKPIKDFAEYVVADLVDNGVIVIPQGAEIASIRYGYGNSITIEFYVSPTVYDTEEKNDFLYVRSFVCLEDFGLPYEHWKEFRDFLMIERAQEGYGCYVSTVLPIAKKIANDFTVRYNEYIQAVGYENVKCGFYTNLIALKADSYLSELHSKLIDKMNERLTAENFPVLSDEEILIDLGGIFIDGESKCVSMKVGVDFQNFRYLFDFDFNQDGTLETQWLLYFVNASKAGYVTGTDYLYIPHNEEYAEFFEAVKIEEMDFSSVVLSTLIGENTYLYF